MWNAPQYNVPEQDILKDHMRVLEEAVADSEMYDVRNAAVYEALNYLEQKRPDLRWHCVQFREALEHWSPYHLHAAMENIEKKF